MKRLAVLVSLCACGGGDDSVDTAAVVAKYSAVVRASYSASIAGAANLRTAVDAFVDAPSDATLMAAKQAWVDSRVPYRQTEAYRFYGGPIDDPDDEPELRINSWPLDENYIDTLIDGTDALTTQFLQDKNFLNGETNISMGYHAIEYLLWGKDESTAGPGNRPFTDYTEAPNAARRGQYLKLAAEALVEDLEHVASHWDGDYDVELETVAGNEALRRILTGIGALATAELSGERMRVAYENKDQEDEHSCFSDTTIDDLVGNARGIENVYLGRFGPENGPGIYDLLAATDQALADRLRQEIVDAIADVEAIPPPFDQAILGDDSSAGRVALLAAINQVTKVGDSIGEAATALGVTINPNP